ncbi:hypothetical protein ACUXKE_002246 [Staphylococcus epidermidis]
MKKPIVNGVLMRHISKSKENGAICINRTIQTVTH